MAGGGHGWLSGQTGWIQGVFYFWSRGESFMAEKVVNSSQKAIGRINKKLISEPNSQKRQRYTLYVGQYAKNSTGNKIQYSIILRRRCGTSTMPTASSQLWYTVSRWYPEADHTGRVPWVLRSSLNTTRYFKPTPLRTVQLTTRLTCSQSQRTAQWNASFSLPEREG